MLSIFSTGDIKADACSLLYSKSKEKAFAHSRDVAEMNMKIAEQYSLDRDVCELGGYLHDISVVVPPLDMMAYAIENCWHIDESEKKIPFFTTSKNFASHSKRRFWHHR